MRSENGIPVPLSYQRAAMLRDVIETEVKVRCDADPAWLIVRAGVTETQSRRKESDQLYDTSAGELRDSGRVLRVRRRGDEWILTYKGKAGNDKYKSREEQETPVTSAIDAILAGLGYRPSFYYEKYRTEYRDGTGLITVDETPIGVFLEFEGPGEWIDATAARLGFTPADYITASYAKLYREHVEQHGGDPTAMRFSL